MQDHFEEKTQRFDSFSGVIKSFNTLPLSGKRAKNRHRSKTKAKGIHLLFEVFRFRVFFRGFLTLCELDYFILN